MNYVCVFCGSRRGAKPVYEEAARQLGSVLATRRLRLIYGGGNVGLMGILADSVLAHGGEVTGVIPVSLANRELAHAGVSDLRIVNSMHERKALMAELSDGFLALPGGLGTFEELCEILTWAQLGFHHKPIAMLNIDGYYDPFAMLLDRAVAHDFMRSEHRRFLIEANTVSELADLFFPKTPPPTTDDNQAIRQLT
jgi:uncharacterized protein (TIGR00730 family)